MSNVLRGAVFAPKAINGKSAYEIAVMHGFDGTEEEWLESLHGEGGSGAVGGSGLPDIMSEDEGKVLTAKGGKAVWDKAKGGSVILAESIDALPDDAEDGTIAVIPK